MTSRIAGSAVMALGVVVLVAGILETAGSSGDGPTPGTPSTTTSVALPATTAASSPSTTGAPTTTAAPTTTTREPRSTTTIAVETVDEFVAAFAQALAQGDVEFVFSRLHPAVIDLYGEDLCRAWTEREIMTLGEYQLKGAVEGPDDVMVSAGGETRAVQDVYVAPIRFTFQGEAFDSQGQYALLDGVVHWLGVCR